MDLPPSANLPQINSSSGYLDGYFSAAVYGQDGIPESNLASAEFDEKVADRVRHVQAMIRAQQYNLCARVDIPADTTNPPLNATATNPNQLRLVQQPISTRVLEALLAVMLLCGLLVACLLDTKKVLPKNPCSIAALASLLADSRLVDEQSGILPPGAEWMSEAELKERLSGYRFRMGWFNQTEKGGGRFTIDVADSNGGLEGLPAVDKVERKPLFAQDLTSPPEALP